MRDYEKNYPLVSTKVEGLGKKFDLSDKADRADYFQQKVGAEIAKLREFMSNNVFVGFWLGKKNSGKGTYSKLMAEIFGEDKIGHISVGDVVRAAHADMEDEVKKAEIVDYLKKNYRGYISVEQALDALLGRDTKTLLPTEFIMALVKRQVESMPHKTLFLDGFPREIDQVSYSLFFRKLIGYDKDQDLFICIDIPEAVIDERMKYRVVCPKCKTPRNLKLLATKFVGYDKETGKFKMMCDNPECEKAVMVSKEGDELGIETIRERLNLDQSLIEKVMSIYGVPKILLRNAVPADRTTELTDDYEVTPEYVFKYNEATDQVDVSEKPWSIKDDFGIESNSLLSPPVVVSLIRQLAKVLGL